MDKELLERKSSRKDYMAAYYKQNKEKKQKYAKEYYTLHKDEIIARLKENKEKQSGRPTKRIFVRQADILKVLSKQRKQIGDVNYHLLIDEVKKLDKNIFAVIK